MVRSEGGEISELMSDSTTKSAVIIGAGMVAGTHIAACEAAREHVHVNGVWARNSERCQAFAKDASAALGYDVTCFDTLDSVAKDSDVDFAIVLTPPNARKAIIQPLAAAGKHILLEKPVGRNGDEAREIVQLCHEADVSLGIVFQHRMRAASIAAAELIGEGALGQLGLVEITVPWWRDQSYYDEPGRGTYERDGGGVLISQAIHTIDLALSLTGPVKSINAMARTTRFHEIESEDFVVAGLEFECGAVGSFTASTASFPGTPESISLHFDKASLTLARGELQVSWRDGRSELFGAAGGTGGGADPMAFTHEWHQGIIEDFATALNEGRAPIATGEAALAAHDFIDAIIRSAKTGQTEDVNQ